MAIASSRLFLLISCFCIRVKGHKPNVILFIADDLGWDDVGYHGSGQVLTPVIDTLASQAVVLDSYYSSPACSPSRAALLTGVHPIHSSMQNFVIRTAEPRGLPLHLQLLPQYLSPFGYKSHLIGKWHLGFYKSQYTPTRRGFDSHFGYWTGEIGYYDHTALEDTGSWGVDFRDDMDLAVNYSGKYSTSLFTDRALRIIHDHDTQHPLFLMMAYQNVHTGNNYSRLEAPEELRRHFPHIRDEHRKTFAGMLLAMDQSMGTIMHSLKSRDMLKNSIVIFASDNGAAVAGFEGNYGSNWPLRGTKYSLWEGGIRVPAFIWSPLLKPHVNRQLFHVTDWLPTLLSAIGADRGAPLSPEYGLSQWESLTRGTTSPRQEILHNIDPVWNISSIRINRFKLVQGLILREWQGWFPPPRGRHSHDAAFVSTRIVCDGRQSSDCAPDSALCLFDIEKDPCERDDIADREPGLVRRLWRRVQQLADTASPAGREERDARSWPPMHGYAWSCWQDEAQAASE